MLSSFTQRVLSFDGIRNNDLVSWPIGIGMNDELHSRGKPPVKKFVGSIEPILAM